MTTVILYTRVSSEDQARDGYSLPEQLRGLRELCVRLGWEVLEEIVDDGWSRSTLDRHHPRPRTRRGGWCGYGRRLEEG